MTIKCLTKTLCSLSLLFLASCAATKSRNSDFLTSYKDLEQKNALSDAVTYKGDLNKLVKYQKVFIEEVKVLKPTKMAKKNVTDADIARLEKIFRSSLETELKKADYKLTNRKGANTLSIRAAVTDFQPGNPALFSSSYLPYVSTAATVVGAVSKNKFGKGSATIEVEVVDSLTRERFFAIIDRNTGTKFEIKSGLSRWGHVELAFRQWAKTLCRKCLRAKPNNTTKPPSV